MEESPSDWDELSPQVPATSQAFPKAQPPTRSSGSPRGFPSRELLEPLTVDDRYSPASLPLDPPPLAALSSSNSLFPRPANIILPTNLVSGNAHNFNWIGQNA